MTWKEVSKPLLIPALHNHSSCTNLPAFPQFFFFLNSPVHLAGSSGAPQLQPHSSKPDIELGKGKQPTPFHPLEERKGFISHSAHHRAGEESISYAEIICQGPTYSCGTWLWTQHPHVTTSSPWLLGNMGTVPRLISASEKILVFLSGLYTHFSSVWTFAGNLINREVKLATILLCSFGLQFASSVHGL